METRPAFLGRGRGRGKREQRSNSQHGSNFRSGEKSDNLGKTTYTSAWNSGGPVRVGEKSNISTIKAPDLPDRHKKVEEIRQAVSNFNDDTYLSSSDSDENINDDEVLRNTLTTYQGL